MLELADVLMLVLVPVLVLVLALVLVVLMLLELESLHSVRRCRCCGRESRRRW